MIKCPKCGKEFETEIKFCDECGTKIVVNTSFDDSISKRGEYDLKNYRLLFGVLAIIIIFVGILLLKTDTFSAIVLFIASLYPIVFWCKYHSELKRRELNKKNNNAAIPQPYTPPTQQLNQNSLSNDNIDKIVNDTSDNIYQTITKHDDIFKKRKIEEFEKGLSEIPVINFTPNGEKMKKRLASDLAAVEFANITRSTNVDKLFPFVVIDTETTGIKLSGNDIIELSAIKIDKGFIPVSCFTTLININKDLSDEITDLTGISKDMLDGKPYFYQVRNAFNEYISGCNIVGHNLIFDMKFLYINGIDFPKKPFRYFDTLQIAKKILKSPKKVYDREINSYEYDYDSDYDVENYKLETLCDYYYIYRNNAHRSLSDCYATFKLFMELLDEKDLI